MRPGSEIPVIVPSSDSIFRRPLPSTGSPRSGSPASSVLRGTPTSCRPSRLASLSFARPVPSVRTLFAPVGQGRAARGPGRCSSGARPGLSNGDDGTSQVPGQPLRTCLGLRSRRSWCAEVPGFALRFRAPMMPSTSITVSASRTLSLSGLDLSARPPAVYASPAPRGAHDARLASGW